MSGPKHNRCELSEERLWSWVDRDAPELREHLEHCSSCGERVAEIRGTIEQVAVATTPHLGALPERIGDFAIRRLIGEGGQGLVYEAEQQIPRRRVALKVLKSPGGGNGRDHRQFEREVESLARLRHPGIAAIYEAGTSADGRKYFAMELIDGASLRVHVRREALSSARRLQLFRRICEPVSYAHQHGVIHRDLKPTNILIDAQGEPHVLDFGLARLTDADVTLTYTLDGAGGIQGTLPYISPEQAGGDRNHIDVRSDVYSLGVMLYQLLTDRLPHEVSNRLPHEALRAIREDMPTRPSSIDTALRGDIETIILKALEKEPARRYQSVASLADDIDRYLRGDAILARPPSASYQLRKLIRRHRVPFAFATVLMVLITAFGVVSAVQAARIARERDNAVAARKDEAAAHAEAVYEARNARAAAQHAEGISDFLEQLLLAADPRWTKSEMTVRELLQEAERRLDADWADNSALEAELRTIVAHTYHQFGVQAKAEPQLRTALRILENVHGGDHPAVAEVCDSLALALVHVGKRDESVRLHERALAIRQRVFGVGHALTIETMHKLAMLRRLMKDYDEAERLYTEILVALRERPGAADGDVAAALHRLAEVLALRKNFAVAEKYHREALGIHRRLHGSGHPDVPRSLNHLADMFHGKGDYEKAERLYREALQRFRAIAGQTPNVMLVLLNLGELMIDSGRTEAAPPFFEEALDMARATMPKWHYITLACHKAYGDCLIKLERFVDAERSLRISFAGYRELGGTGHMRTREAAESLSLLYEKWQRPTHAAEYQALAVGTNAPAVSDTPITTTSASNKPATP